MHCFARDNDFFALIQISEGSLVSDRNIRSRRLTDNVGPLRIEGDSQILSRSRSRRYKEPYKTCLRLSFHFSINFFFYFSRCRAGTMSVSTAATKSPLLTSTSWPTTASSSTATTFNRRAPHRGRPCSLGSTPCD